MVYKTVTNHWHKNKPSCGFLTTRSGVEQFWVLKKIPRRLIEDGHDFRDTQKSDLFNSNKSINLQIFQVYGFVTIFQCPRDRRGVLLFYKISVNTQVRIAKQFFTHYFKFIVIISMIVTVAISIGIIIVIIIGISVSASTKSSS